MTAVRRWWCRLTGRACPWQPHQDATIRYLRQQRAASLRTTRELRRARTGNLLRDQLIGGEEDAS